MTKEQELILNFATEIIRPWEELNKELSKEYSVSPQHSVYINMANALAVSLKHLAESNGGPKSSELNKLSEDYLLISDLADTKKHGKRDNPLRSCKISTASLYERKFDEVVLLRFLRNTITMDHVTHGKRDFMHCAKECAIFLADQLKIQTDWKPIVFNNSGKFSNRIETYASKDNQVVFTGFNLHVVELNEQNEFIAVDINGTFEFHLISEF
ncbi:hypothetical protein [Fluviicola sp.]|uniref:hypothetical protein n=1 Tax=Fluviicola sp. TaxID=1917219 RepID=UPI003D2BCC9C